MNPPTRIPRRLAVIQSRLAPILPILSDPLFTGRLEDPLACDFLFGNPQEMPLSGFVEALQRVVTPQNKDWFAYKMSEPEARRAVAEGLRAWRGDLPRRRGTRKLFSRITGALRAEDGIEPRRQFSARSALRLVPTRLLQWPTRRDLGRARHSAAR